ncbi:hypothetical protein CB0940_06691 [Cercospora beticola]|uniref:Glycosyl transferase family 25 domain-containing protein n=2 Tax=Cercospora beticola TaxID=122368 RepID=A0A2G5HZY8_CERBT|nr:hypothetical protein CB0940_06691 [Cercospora beticola]PIA97823.1 hypothetical protein CB0940_06691 [Cercospora beticola]CAK1360694.1 unnamed protein product [Cercospora beticola]
MTMVLMRHLFARQMLLASSALATLLLVILILGVAKHPSLPGFQFAEWNITATHNDTTAPALPELLDDVANATLGFQKIFVINLASRTDRRDSATLAATLTGMKFEFVEAVTHVDQKFMPPGAEDVDLKEGAAAAWRSHVNILRRIVDENISSALILEDDADWDIRIKSQMRDFARASRRLLQPLVNGTDQSLEARFSRPLPVNYVLGDANTTEPMTSPYGDLDLWDMLWIGHCGVSLPLPGNASAISSQARVMLPKEMTARVMIPNDITVPPRKYIEREFSDRQLVSQYPDYTRVVARTRGGTCSLAYGVSQAGARKLLWETGIRALTAPMDLMYRSLCDGTFGRDMINCLSPSPALFGHYRPPGSSSTWSNIDDLSDEEQKDYPTSGNIRWGARFNIHNMVNGKTDYWDPFEDEG